MKEGEVDEQFVAVDELQTLESRLHNKIYHQSNTNGLKYGIYFLLHGDIQVMCENGNTDGSIYKILLGIQTVQDRILKTFVKWQFSSTRSRVED